METLYVFPNPYGHMDHKGRLSGACPEAEERPAGAMPSRRLVGAVLTMIAGSYNADASEGRGPGGTVPSNADLTFKFTAEAPIKMDVSGALAHFYRKAARDGDIILCAGADDLPLEKLAAARNALIADQKARYGAAPDTSKFAEQFSLDAIVADVAKALSDKAEVDAKKAADAAKKASDEAAKAAKSVDAPASAMDLAKAKAAKLVSALGQKPAAAPPPAPAAGSKE
jgi:hypothetical protein